MAKVGRKAKPTALKLIQGNPGNRPINKHEPQPAKVYSPDAPSGFDDLETAKWFEVTAKLAKIRLLTELDLDAIEVYCREWVNYHHAIADIADRGKLMQTPQGGVMWNPSWTQLKHSQKICRSIMAEFGMTPSTRTTLVASADETGKNRWSSF